MADVMSHGGDAGGDPPHQGNSQIPVQCQSCKYYNYYLGIMTYRYPVFFVCDN